MEEGWGGGAVKVMLKITEIIVAKIKTFGQDHGWILTKFAKKRTIYSHFDRVSLVR